MRTALLGLLFVAAPALAGPVRLTTADGVSLAAKAWGSGANGVVLVHDDQRSSADFDLFGERLGTKGFHVIAIDLRGHGASTASITDADYPLMVQDVAAAVGWLREQGASRVHLLGAGLGANLAVHAAAADPAIADLALLSPGMNLRGVASPTAFEQYGARPALVVAASGDAYGARSASVLERKAQGPLSVELLDGDASGVVLINRDPHLEGKLVAWFNGTYDLTGQREARGVTAQESGEVETSGVRFGN
jgi:pimeloyl-ACP methyl ester carboxylesterase